MATAPMTGAILPQYQGDYYALQNKQALAQALMGSAIQNQASQIPSNMPVMPKFSIGAGLAQLGQALLAGKMQKDVSQGYQGLGQQQMAYLLGSPASSGQAAPTGAQDPSAQASPGAGAPAAGVQSQGGLLSPGGPLNPNGMDPRAAVMMYLSGPEGRKELFKSTTSAYAPTPATLAARQGNMDPVEANRRQFSKDSYVAPYTGTGVARNPFSMAPMAFTPEAPQNASPVFDASGNVVGFRGIEGGQQILQGNAAAKTAGEGSQLPGPTQYDAQGNPLPTMSRTDVANQQAPMGIRNNNPGNLRPGGQFAQYPDMQTGLQKLDENLQSYGKQGVNTLSGVISKWAPPGENNTDAYIKDAAARLGISPDQKIDLSNPVQRQAIATAIALHENGSSGVFGQSSAAYSAPPLAAQKSAEGLASGQIDTMQKSYQGLQGARAGGNSALQDIDNMIGLSQGKNVATAGTYLAKLAGLTSANAAEYEKSRDNLVTNLSSQLGMSTDSARDLVYGSIPNYGAPKQAIENGLNTLKSQVQMRMIKADYLSQAYAGGDAKTYNRLENQFDQNMTPKVSAVIAMPAGPQRAQALSMAAKDPQIRAKLEWAAQNGVLK